MSIVAEREALLVQCVGELGRGVVVLDGEAGMRDYAAMTLTLDAMEMFVRLALSLAKALAGEATR